MISAHGFAARSSTGGFRPFSFSRRDVGPDDVLIEIQFCGICHSDIHSVRDEWGGAVYPMVPGHEIVGRVAKVGRRVKRFHDGDLAGIGCYVGSCGRCAACRRGEEQFCPSVVWTYNGSGGEDGRTTRGGYADRIVVNQRFAFRLQKGLPLERMAPLLCAGITTYSPLRRAGVRRGTRVGVLGLGGLGHIAVKIAAALGGDVTVFTTSPEKAKDARRLGARSVVITKRKGAFDAVARQLDVVLDTVSATHDAAPYLRSLRDGGRMTLVGAPEKPLSVAAFSLINGRKQLGGSLIGGLKETQEMLDFCARRQILADVEVIQPTDIDRAYDRAVAGDVKFRFVIDLRH